VLSHSGALPIGPVPDRGFAANFLVTRRDFGCATRSDKWPKLVLKRQWKQLAIEKYATQIRLDVVCRPRAAKIKHDDRGWTFSRHGHP
jgi:hypothetical protein